MEKRKPREYVGIVCTLEGALQFVELVAGKCRSVSTLLRPFERVSNIFGCRADIVVSFAGATLETQDTDR